MLLGPGARGFRPFRTGAAHLVRTRESHGLIGRSTPHLGLLLLRRPPAVRACVGLHVHRVAGPAPPWERPWPPDGGRGGPAASAERVARDRRTQTLPQVAEGLAAAGASEVRRLSGPAIIEVHLVAWGDSCYPQMWMEVG